MRIALDATYSIDPHPSGIAVYSRELLTGLAAQHADDRFIHAYRWKQWRQASAPVQRNIAQRLLLPPVPTFFADLFHGLNQRVDKRPAKRVVSTFHDLFVMTGDYSTKEFRERFTKQAKKAAQHSDLIITVSEFTACQVSTLLDVERSRIRVIPHGVHMPARSDIAREKIILFVGAIQKRKNVERLVEAFEQVSADWRLVLAGSPHGYEAKRILQKIEHSRCGSRIEITGYVTQPELTGLYARASVFGFPSLDEGFGMPVLEAMAHGIPVITSRRSALPEVAGDAAVLVHPEDSDELAGALVDLTTNEWRREELTYRGRARAVQFPWERSVRETYGVYQQAMK